MADEFRLATEAQNVEFKAFSREFEHPDEDEAERRRAVLYVLATLSFPDSGWNVIVTPIEGSVDEWILLEDAPAFRDHDRSYYVAAGNTEHQVPDVPKTISIQHGDETTRVSVVPWD